MADRTWKAFERRLARMFGTERIPAAGVMGFQQTNAADFETSRVCFQAKKGYHPPSYLRDWLSGIVTVAQPSGRVGAVVWAGKGVKDDEALVILRAVDFCTLLDKIPE